MSDIPTFSPGCFGSALAYQEDHAVCRSCSFNATCKPLHETNLATLRARFKIVPSATRRFEMKDDLSGARVLPKKTQELIERVDRMDIDITGKLARGENPFSVGALPKLRLAAHLLLRMASVSHKQLTHAYCTRFGWSEKTADALARQTMQVFLHIGAIEGSDGVYRLRKQQQVSEVN